MKRRTFLKKSGYAWIGVFSAGLVSSLLPSCQGITGRKPNILIITTDDQGYADLSAYQHHAADIETPNMDRLAGEGMLFTRAYVTAPVCSPSRAGWNTGMYQERWDPDGGWNPGLPEEVQTIAELMKTNGYATGKVGKSDFGTDYHRMDVREYPLNHGYDEFLGFSSHAHDYFLLSAEIENRTPDPHGHSAALGTLFENNSRVSIEDGYTTELFTDWAMDFMKRHQQDSFFLSVSYNSVHHLIHEVPEEYLEKFDAPEITNYNPDTMDTYNAYYNKYNQLGAISDEEMRKYYLANLNCLDDNIGRLLDSLEELGLSEDTLVIFFSDNGGSPLTGANNRPLRGGKYIMYEGGIRVPFMMRWPGELPEKSVYSHRVSSLDILPTCLEVIGAAGPGELDGNSMLRSLRDESPVPSSEDPFFCEFRDQYTVIFGDWKLVKTRDQQQRQPTSQILGGPSSNEEVQLFNLSEDPSEQNDLYDEYPDTAKRLEEMYRSWKDSMVNSGLKSTDGA